ncbi:hypothetical protein MCNF_01600 [Mycolicibacterium confluentis]|uniref:Uncharacterized protein n=1 Tax=Mycolicibacterium confluentis TaxID=28047 RepID=A0A7I7XQT7_9MYCO|nr:hypothetical protein MCNF_01600 [Mycolicibacterium confluentis]
MGNFDTGEKSLRWQGALNGHEEWGSTPPYLGAVAALSRDGAARHGGPAKVQVMRDTRPSGPGETLLDAEARDAGSAPQIFRADAVARSTSQYARSAVSFPASLTRYVNTPSATTR